MFEVRSAGWQPAGRPGASRAGFVWIGLMIAGCGVLIIVFPEVIAYAIGAMMILTGLGVMGSALKFPRVPRGPRGPGPQDENVTVVVEAVDESD